MSEQIEDKYITIACVGDSITYGLTIDNPEDYGYPMQLQLLLGPRFIVNPSLGKCGAGVWHHGAPYTCTQEYRDAIKWPADILVVCLGTNDAIYPMDDTFKQEFVEDYKLLIHQLIKESPHEKVYICQVPPVPGVKELSGAVTIINELIKSIAESCNYTLIDLYTPFLSREDLFSDGVHPNEEGAAVIAKFIYQSIRDDKNKKD